jgi:preprotein translocase subunit SecY
VGNKQYGGVRNFLPLKVNAAGVMPIIFAQAIMFLPLTLSLLQNNLPEVFGKVLLTITDLVTMQFSLS